MTRINKQITIDAPQAHLWTILADIGGVAKWAPTVSHAVTTSEATEGLGCERHCEVPGVGSVDETVTEWDEGRSMAYDVEGAPFIKSMHNRFSLKAEGDRTVVTMTSEFRPKFGPLGALMGALVMKRRLGATIEQTLAGLKHYAETGEVIGTEVPQAAAA